MGEKDNKEKMTLSEKRATRLQDRFNTLRERIDKRPPSSALGRKRALKNLHILSAIIDGRMDLNDRRAFFDSEVFNEEDRYYKTQTEINNSITDLSMKKNAALNEIAGLKDEKSKQSRQQKRIIGKMSRRYRSQLGSMEAIDQVRKREQDLKEEVKRIDSVIEEQQKLIKENIETFVENKKAIKLAYKEDLKQIRKNNKERLAKANPNLFRRIGDWVQERRTKSAKMLMEGLKETEQTSKRKMFLRSNAADVSLREQADNAAKAREGFSDMEEYKTMQVAGENLDKEEIEWLSELQDNPILEAPEETGTEIR